MCADVDDTVQGITGARALGVRCVELSMTLVVAGFIIGPGGSSIRDIVEKTGSRIRSFNEPVPGPWKAGKMRVFLIQGSKRAIEASLKIMIAAVVRYKELAEGKSAGQCVDTSQVVGGVEFMYLPPPKSKNPLAASVASTKQ